MKPNLPPLIAYALLLLCLQPLSAATDGEIEQALMTRVPELFTNGQVITRGDLDTIGADTYAKILQTVFSGDVYQIFALTNYDTPLRKKNFEKTADYARYQRRLELLEDQFRRIEWVATLSQDHNVVYDLASGMLRTTVRWSNHFNWPCSGFFGGTPVYKIELVGSRGGVGLHLAGRPARENEYSPMTLLVLECPVSEQQAANLEKSPLVRIRYKVAWDSYIADVALQFHDAQGTLLATLPVRESIKPRSGRWRYEVLKQQFNPLPAVLTAEIPASGTGYRYETSSGGAIPAKITVSDYTNGVLHGKSITYKPDMVSNAVTMRTLSEEHYANGKKHGIAKTYYDDGKVWTQHAYKSGELHGPGIHYGRNGSVIKRLSYQAGKLHGSVVVRGRMLIDATYHHGVPTGYFTVTMGRKIVRMFFWNSGRDVRFQTLRRNRIVDDETYKTNNAEFKQFYDLIAEYMEDATEE